jgi:hypothetical protein
MDSSRLKNIAILILLALNLCFLAIIGLNRYEAGRAGQEEKRELAELFGTAGIAVEAETLPDAENPRVLLLSRDTEAEKALVASLLGEAEQTDQGGNIYSYENERGRALFRGSGEFEILFRRLEGADEPERTARSLLKALSVETLGAGTAVTEDGARSLSFPCAWEGKEILNASVRLSLYPDGSALLSGRRVNGQVQPAPEETGLGSTTVLLAFLEAVRSGGLVCSRIERIERCWLLTATSSGTGLSPVWRVVTDGGEYRLDGESGSILK